MKQLSCKLWVVIAGILLSLSFSCQEKSSSNGTGEGFQIGVFWPPVWEHTNLEQYKIMKEGNVDYIQNVIGSLLDTEEQNKKMLELAEQTGLKIYVADKRVKGSEEDIKEMIETYKDYKAVSGYYIVDEPDIPGLDDVAKRYKTILKYAPDKTPYVNLLPHWAGPVAENYEEGYVNKWIELCGKENMKYLSYDSYPFMHDGSFRESHYVNLDMIRKAGLKNKIKTSCYTQSVGIPGAYRRPDAVDLRYSAYTSAIYGIKNIVWFTYWTPTNRGEVFTNAVIDSLGNKTDLYEPFKQINGELKQLGKTLGGLDAMEVYHTGRIPEGCLPLPEDFIFLPQSFTDDFIVSYFSNEKNDTYVMILNRSLKEIRTIDIALNDRYKAVSLVSAVTGKKEKVALSSAKIFEETLAPGDARLYYVK